MKLGLKIALLLIVIVAIAATSWTFATNPKRGTFGYVEYPADFKSPIDGVAKLTSQHSFADRAIRARNDANTIVLKKQIRFLPGPSHVVIYTDRNEARLVRFWAKGNQLYYMFYPDVTEDVREQIRRKFSGSNSIEL